MSNDSMSIKQTPPSNMGSMADAQAGLMYLEASLEIQHVEGAFQRLAALRTASETVIVDISRVETIDTAGMQLLLALRAESQRQGAKISIRGSSAAIVGAVTLLGLQNFTASAAGHAI